MFFLFWIASFNIPTILRFFWLFFTGVWLWHCHFDKHFTWGMATVFIVKNGKTPETSLLPPPAYMPPCTVPSPIRLEDFEESTEIINTSPVI